VYKNDFLFIEEHMNVNNSLTKVISPNIDISQQKTITSFISTATAQKVSANVSKSISSENVESSQDVVFDDRPPNVKPGPAKRFHSCLSSDSDHSLCIENELKTIKTNLDKAIKRDGIENIVSSIMGNLVINLKKEIKQEIMIEKGKK
jgi:hypothetical protein